jgi:hypothetical protein
MEQFVDFTFMKSMDLGSKADMSYRLRCLLNEQIDLTKYGHTVQSILISPLIGSFFHLKANTCQTNKGSM